MPATQLLRRLTGSGLLITAVLSGGCATTAGALGLGGRFPGAPPRLGGAVWAGGRTPCAARTRSMSARTSLVVCDSCNAFAVAGLRL